MAKLQSAIVKDFTVIHNEFVKDERLGIEEKGMLLLLMSLPSDWDFSIEGLAKLSRSGKCKITTALNRLKKYGYFRRTRETDEKTGRVIDWIYEFSDQPHLEWIEDAEEETNENDDNLIEEIDIPEDTAIEQNYKEEPQSDFQNVAENPQSDFPDMEIQPQLNTNNINTNNILIDRYGEAEFQKIREEVREQINEVNELVVDGCASEEEVEEIIDIMTEVYLSDDAIININGTTMKMTRVQTQFRKLTSDHIKYFFASVKHNKKKVVNVRKYIITSLYNAAMNYHNSVNIEVSRMMR